MRILDLCSRRSISEYMLIYLTGMPPSTIKSIINGRSGNPGIQTIQRIAEGLGITLREFYDSALSRIWSRKNEWRGRRESDLSRRPLHLSLFI